MSRTATRFPIAVRSTRSSLLESALYDEGFEWQGGHLHDIVQMPLHKSWELTQAEADELAAAGWDISGERWDELLAGKSRAARWIARSIRCTLIKGERCADLNYWIPQWVIRRRLWRWMAEREEQMIRLGLAERRSIRYPETAPYWEQQEKPYIRFFPESLMALGIETCGDAERFCAFYEKVQDPKRVWNSSCQRDHGTVAAIALTPNYNRLPQWVREGLIHAPIKLDGDRVGNIWRLIPCVKAWKWAPLPKRVAEKVGKLSPKMRMFAAIAWKDSLAGEPDFPGEWEERKALRAEWLSPQKHIPRFWDAMAVLQQMTLGQVLEAIYLQASDYDRFWGKGRLAALMSQYLGLPHGLIAWGDCKHPTLEQCLLKVAEVGDARTACESLFQASGKATIKAFSECQNPNAWRWAMQLAVGKPDLLQKYFALTECVAYEPDAVEFLRQLGDAPALRMVGTTTFKVRGEEKPVESFHVKDTGYLWNEIRNKPDLRRVRCWLSVHEELARRFIAEQPDNALRVDPRWERVDGLCAVDGTWQIELPRRTAMLQFWGEQLHHCVGGYGPKVDRGDCVIFAVKQDGWVTHTVEMCPDAGSWDCNQFLGDRNSYAPDWLRESVLSVLQQAGLSSSRS